MNNKIDETMGVKNKEIKWICDSLYKPRSKLINRGINRKKKGDVTLK